MRRILFQGATATKVVDDYSHAKVEAEVTPLIVIQDGKNTWGEDELRWGLVLQCIPLTLLEEGKDDPSVLESFEIDSTFSGWSNPVRWWRALQLLAIMPTLTHRNIGLPLWIATDRPDPDNRFDLDRIEEIRSTLAEGHTYEEIMSRPVPMGIIEPTIQLADEGLSMSMMRSDLTDEIQAGTIRWSQALKRIGVEHPDYRHAVHAALDIVVARYEAHLVSYAAFRECPYARARRKKGFIMLVIEDCIYEAIERGIEQEYGQDITAMLAILVEEIACDDIQEEMGEKYPPRNREEGEAYVRPTPEERFRQIITWFTEHFSQGATTTRQREELHEILHRLYDQWETMPIIAPLVR